MIVDFFSNDGFSACSLPKDLSLADFAAARGVSRTKLVLDASRRTFCDYHEDILKRLACGQMKGQNRFRELLLGLKSCGKSEMLRLIHDYCLYRYKDCIIPVFVTYLRNHDRPIDIICSALSERFPDYAEWAAYIVKEKQVTKRVQFLDKFLEMLKVSIVLLVDEFPNVYQLQHDFGVPIVDEICSISDSNEGHNHCIVTGSSSILRKLAMAKMARDLDFPSYTQLNVNSTKLMPRWIFAFEPREYQDLASNCDVPTDRIVSSFICSGGRPGLVRHYDIDNIPYSITLKHNATDDSLHSAILHSLVDGYDPSGFPIDTEKTISSELVEISELLSPIPDYVVIDIINKHYGQSVQCNSKEFEQSLYDLADEGLVRFFSRKGMKMISLTGVQIFLELQQQKMSKLSWRDAVALKYPFAIFDKGGEEVAMRFVREYWHVLFSCAPLRYNNALKTSMDFNPKGPRSNIEIIYTLQDDPNIFCGLLHKELFGGKDCKGGDGILLELVDNANKRTIKLTRVQLKLGKQKMTEADVQAIKDDMCIRGRDIVKSLLDNEYHIQSYKNVLITTRFCQGCKDFNQMECRVGTETDEVTQDFDIVPTFLLHDKQTSHVLWPDYVKLLGEPFAANRKSSLDLFEEALNR